MPLYHPSPAAVAAVAETALVQRADRPGPLRAWQAPSVDWDERVLLNVPGLVWTVVSDTCMTGRPHAPANIAYDDVGMEFVFRQPRDRDELAGVMGAACDEVFDCYRFDGLQRWTPSTVWAWRNQTHVIEGWLRHVLATGTDPEIAQGADAYLTYVTSEDLRTDLMELSDVLRSHPLDRAAAWWRAHRR